MSDAAVAVIVSGAVTIVTMVVGFLTLWIKLKYGTEKAEQAVTKAETAVSAMVKKVGVVEEKVDAAHVTAKLVEGKADTIVEQTNGSLSRIQAMVTNVSERASKLEDYNRESAHRLFDAINSLTLKVERILVMQDTKLSVPPSKGT